MTGAARSVRLRCWGAFALHDGQGGRVVMTSRRGAALLTILALTPSGERARKWLQATLWSSRDDSQAAASLRRELSNLRSLLAAHRIDALVRADHQRVWLDRSRLIVEARQNGDELLEGIDIPGAEGFDAWLRDQRGAAAAEPPPFPVPETPPARPRRRLSDFQMVQAAPSAAVALADFDVDGSPAARALSLVLRESLGQGLGRLPRLRLVDGSGVDALRQSGISAREVAQRFRAHYLIAGTIVSIGSQVRLSLRLVDGQSGEQCFQHDDVAEQSDLLSLAERAGEQALAPIWCEISAREGARGVDLPLREGDAYQLYWRASRLLEDWSRSGAESAVALTRRLTSIAPTSAWAHAIHALALAQQQFHDLHVASAQKAAEVIAHVRTALQQRGLDATVLAKSAGALLLGARQVEEADRLLADANAMQATVGPLRTWMAWVDLAARRFESARRLFEQLCEVERRGQRHAIAKTGLGIARMQLGDLDGAFAALHEAYLTRPECALNLRALELAARRQGAHATADLVGRRIALQSTPASMIAHPIFAAME